MDYRSLYTAYRANPQEPETSREVVRFWHNPQVRYKDEEFSLEARECCLRRVAERIVHRRILGLDGLEIEHAKKAFRVEVFGKGSPLLSELLLPDVFVAMAFVPLTPGESSTNKLPRLARLYCVSGLGGQKRLPFLEGTNEPVLDKYSWFIEGISDRERISGVEGRSWLLAAHILSKIVGRKDKKTACNLAKHYIVTGDVQGGGNICKVEMGRKEELASQKWFANFKWIIPKENDMNIPKRKIEKPETLEDAYKLIEAMQNTATKSFFRFLREGNFDGVKEQIDIGADMYGREDGTDLTCLEVIAEKKASLIEEEVKRLSQIEWWLRYKGAGAATLFYLLAVNGDEEGIEKNSQRYSINACDERGRTAVDIALIMDEYEIAKLLNKFGGVINPRWQANSTLAKYISCMCHWDTRYDSDEKKRSAYIARAIEMGLPFDAKLEVRLDDDGFPTQFPSYCTLFVAAVDNARYDVVDACLKKGADANKELVWVNEELFGDSVRGTYVKKRGTPWAILSQHKGIKEDVRIRFKELLLKYGARISEEES